MSAGVGPAFALLPSPLLGPSVWQPVADRLVGWGVEVLLPPQPRRAPQSPHDVLMHLRAALPGDRDLVLVPHSNSGAYVPELTRDRRIAGVVFVDAVLPPASGRTPLAPGALLGLLRDKTATDGVLPPWTEWWDDHEVAALFPDTAARRAVEREQHRLPLAYFESEVDVPGGWDDRSTAYLAFGDTYAPERAQAFERGWPVRTLSGRHLHMLVGPDAVAEAVVELATARGY